MNKTINEVKVETDHLKQHLYVELMKQKKIIDELKFNEKSLIRNVKLTLYQLILYQY